MVKRPIDTFLGIYILKRIETTSRKLLIRKVSEPWVSLSNTDGPQREMLKQDETVTTSLNLSVVKITQFYGH